MTSPSPLSSFSSRLGGRKAVVALWAVVAIVGVVLVLVLLRDRKGPRDDVAAYIVRVNAVSVSFQTDYRSIERAYRTFALAPKKTGLQEARLKAASARLTTLRERMQRIPAPARAAVLKRRLIAFFRQQEAVSRELIGVSTYVPRLSAAEQVLAPASARMRAALKQGGTAAQQAVALGAYADALDRAGNAVAAVDPPRLFRSSHAGQVARLRHAAVLMHRLGRALAANDKPTLERTLKELGRAPASTAAARTAIQAYNARVVEIRKLAASVERERQRLDKELQ